MHWRQPPTLKRLGNALLSFTNIAGQSPVADDDAVDRLNHWATVGLFTALALGTGAKQFVGVPIQCWIPSEYRKNMYQDYTNNYCWVHHMYNVPFPETIPFEEEDRWDIDISFYRWVTFMFLLQALLFKLPNLLWRELKTHSGLNVEKVVAMINETSFMAQDKRDIKLNHAAIYMHQWLQTYSQYKFSTIACILERLSGFFFFLGKHSGTYLTGLHLFIKMLYCANIVGQFYLLSAFLDLNYWEFGFSAMRELAKRGRWQDLITFPRIGLCDYKIRQMANIQTFSVQCVLSINLFLEKMYLVIWFWMIGLLVVNFVTFMLWLINDIMPGRSERFLCHYAKPLSIRSSRDKTLFKMFVFNYLRRDGVFIVRMVAKNTSEVLTLDLVRQLWLVFKKHLEQHDGHHCAINDMPDDVSRENGGDYVRNNIS